MKTNTYIQKITGKATTVAELHTQVSALSKFRAESEPTADELALYEGKVNTAAAMLSEQFRKERIAELLAMGNGSGMWREFLAKRSCKSVSVKFDKKTGVYTHKEDMRGRINYPELNAAYIERETARKEQAGEVFDPADLTVASNRKFNTLAPGFFDGCYKRFIDHNLGASAADRKSYAFTDKKGKEVKAEAPSINKLVKDLNDLVSYLLPEDFKVQLVKADVRKLGVALSNSTKEALKMKGNGHAFNWLLNVIQERIDSAAVRVIIATNETK